MSQLNSKWSIGQIDPKYPNYVVYAFDPNGKPIWRSIKKMKEQHGGTAGLHKHLAEEHKKVHGDDIKNVPDLGTDSVSQSGGSKASSTPKLSGDDVIYSPSHYGDYATSPSHQKALALLQDMDEEDIREKMNDPKCPADLEELCKMELKKRAHGSDPSEPDDPFDFDKIEYEAPIKRIQRYNNSINTFIKTPNENIFVFGKGGLGKTYGMELQLEKAGKIQFQETGPDAMLPGDPSYDWVSIGNVTSDAALYEILFKHNGKIIVLDDSDGILDDSEACNMLKKAMDTTSPGKAKKVGRSKSSASKTVVKMYDEDNLDGDPKKVEVPGSFDFNGKIAFISNRDFSSFDPNIAKNAATRSPLLQRGIAVNLSFNKKETAELIGDFLDKTNYSGLYAPETFQVSQADFKKEKEEIYSLLKENLDDIPAHQLNMRILRVLINKKRQVEDHNNILDSFTDKDAKKDYIKEYGGKEEWKKEVLKQLQGVGSHAIKKSLREDMYGIPRTTLFKAKQTLGLS